MKQIQICERCFRIRFKGIFGYTENWIEAPHLKEHLLNVAEHTICRYCKIKARGKP